MKFVKKEGISYLGELKSGDKKKISISGQFNDSKWFITEAEIELIGPKEEKKD